MTETHIIEFTTKRCWKCGTFWAIETTHNMTNECPRCARQSINQLQNDVSSLAHTISGLRGAVVRLKNKSKSKSLNK